MPEESRGFLWRENVSVNLDAGTLARIDLLVDRGVFPGRDAFFAQAAERLLGEQSGVLEQIEREERTQKRIFFIGVTRLGHKDLQVYRARNEKIRIEGYGILILEKDMDDLIRETVEGISVRGKVFCSERIRKIYLPTY